MNPPDARYPWLSEQDMPQLHRYELLVRQVRALEWSLGLSPAARANLGIIVDGELALSAGSRNRLGLEP